LKIPSNTIRDVRHVRGSEKTDGAGISNESHHQTLAIQRLGHGYDRQNQPSIQHILAITDYFTKWVEAIPMKTVTSKDVINFIKEHVIHRFGIL
jgi:hypothetical protein